MRSEPRSGLYELVRDADKRARAIEPLQSAPAAPKHLGTEGKRIWRLILRERYKTLTAAELPIFERYAELCDRRKDLLKALETNGWSTSGSRPGMRVLAPEGVALETVERELRQLERVWASGLLTEHVFKIDVLAVEHGLERLEQQQQRPPAGFRYTGQPDGSIEPLR